MRKTTVHFNKETARELIKASGRTQVWYAKQMGISRNYLSQMLSGGRSPSRPIIKLLAQSLEVEEGVLDLGLQGQEAS
jgi:transcriptional regulator with XRE-family HTH domain